MALKGGTSKAKRPLGTCTGDPRSFTNAEYEIAKRCLQEKKKYEIHLVVGVGTDSCKHFIVPVRDFIADARPEVMWYLPVRKNFDKYGVSSSGQV